MGLKQCHKSGTYYFKACTTCKGDRDKQGLSLHKPKSGTKGRSKNKQC